MGIRRREITVRGGKGDEDRRVILATGAVPDVERAMRRAWERWKVDRVRGAGLSKRVTCHSFRRRTCSRRG